MKYITSIGFIILALAQPLTVLGGYSLNKASEWPLGAPTLFLQGGVNAVIEGGDYLFWAQGDTITIINKNSFSADSTSTRTISLKTATGVQDMLFDETSSTLYVAAGYDSRAQSGGLQVFSLAVPTAPVRLVTVDQSADNPGAYIVYNDDEAISEVNPHIDARGLGFYENTLFLADDNFGLRVFDVSNPAAPTEIPLSDEIQEKNEHRISGYIQPDVKGSYDITGGYVSLDLHVFNQTVYAVILDFYHGIKVFDVTDTAAIDDPVLKDTRSYMWFGAVSLLFDLDVAETSDRLSAFVCGTDATNTAYVVSRMDLAPPDPLNEDDEPLLIRNYGVCEMPGQARSVVASGDYAYVADGSSGLQIVDISSEPTDASEVLDYDIAGEYSTGVSSAYALALDAGYVYLASVESGLTKINISNPEDPKPDSTGTTQIDSPMTADRIEVSGNYTYMLDADNGLRIFSSEDPLYLLLESNLENPGTATDLVVAGEYVYIAGSTGGIRLVDVSDPANPAFLTEGDPATDVTIPATAPRVLYATGTYLFIGDQTDGLIIVNIQDPLNPEVLGSIPCAGAPTDLWVDESRAYVTEGSSGLEIFDISAPSSPHAIVRTVTTDARSVAVLTDGNQIYALVADGNAGVKLFDVTDLSQPIGDPVNVTTRKGENQGETLAIDARHIRVQDTTALVALADQTLLDLDLATPTTPVEVDAFTTGADIGDVDVHTADETAYVILANKRAGIRFLYLYDSSGSDDSNPLVPSIDAGCFIQSTLLKPIAGQSSHPFLDAIHKLMFMWSPGS